jgi:periplasmic protein TonB
MSEDPSMAERPPVQQLDASVGHLSVHLGGQAQDVQFLFERPQRRLLGAAGFSMLGHSGAILAVFLVFTYTSSQTVQDVFHNNIKDIIWIAQPGRGGGGGGGGNRMPDPPKLMTALPRTVVVPKPEVPTPVPVPEDTKLPELVLPAKTLIEALPGATEGTSSNTASQGPGSGGGYGTGTGTGIGPGQGPGLGPGSGGGTGGGAYEPGNGVSWPVKLKEVKPEYTADAMRAKIQGVVELECVVMPDGTVGSLRVTRSLDPIFGLDEKAVKAARQWRFIPGMKGGQPVPVLIFILMEFTLR